MGCSDLLTSLLSSQSTGQGLGRLPAEGEDFLAVHGGQRKERAGSHPANILPQSLTLPIGTSCLENHFLCKQRRPARRLLRDCWSKSRAGLWPCDLRNVMLGSQVSGGSGQRVRGRRGRLCCVPLAPCKFICRDTYQTPCLEQPPSSRCEAFLAACSVRNNREQ